MARWDRIISRGNVEDRRGMRGPAVVGGGLSLTGVALLFLLNYLAGGNFTDVLNQIQPVDLGTEQYGAEEFAGEDQYEVFASTVLGSTNDMWSRIFSERNRSFDPPKLVLFRQATESACGVATSDIGPHYCPLDETIYLDETFFDELTRRFGAEGGDVAEAYVIAHEAAHHAQHKLGIMETTDRGSNEASIKLELQADCFAGLWANSIRELDVFLPGEIREAIGAAAAVGDDRIQQATTGRISPEVWTHGSSAERVEWFNRGFESGTLEACDTFAN